MANIDAVSYGELELMWTDVRGCKEVGLWFDAGHDAVNRFWRNVWLMTWLLSTIEVIDCNYKKELHLVRAYGSIVFAGQGKIA